jgi:hypothetical protein
MIGFIIPHGTAPDVGEIEFSLRDRVPDWAMPDEIMVVDSVPTHGVDNELCAYCLMEKFYEKREPS